MCWRNAAPSLDASYHNLIAIFENYVAEIRLDGKAVQLALWDTAYVTFPASFIIT